MWKVKKMAVSLVVSALSCYVFRSCSVGLRLDGGLESAYRASGSQGRSTSRHMGIRRRKMVRVASGVVSASIHVVSLMMFHVTLRSI
ncbi:hypothetical protein BO99DRAFT_171826 [Aspergillus violaceofuscus CBS 115571]|uniref:Uncharacterized protein n=1 Tax=Aspergillus violaceofuscus (strain CBS 115571) TaxID=1450538 RepID=A0A2V5HB17_ASPV1|nr:hypothetical protein BO99DRAFT_171826 [Aspergillus violaceofuscus CBS 115571]